GPWAPIVVDLGAELHENRDVRRPRGARPSTQLRVEVASKDARERVGLLRVLLRRAGPVEVTRVRLERDVGNLAVAPDLEDVRAGKAQSSKPVVGEVRPGELPADEPLESIDLRCPDVIL